MVDDLEKNKNILRQEAECSFPWMGKFFFAEKEPKRDSWTLTSCDLCA